MESFYVDVLSCINKLLICYRMYFDNWYTIILNCLVDDDDDDISTLTNLTQSP